MKSPLLFAELLGVVLFCGFGCGMVSSCPFTVDNGCFRVEFSDPESSELGCRFLRAGWIRSLCPAGSPESLFRTETLFSYHPSFGYASEITPELDLGGSRALQIGVGIIERHQLNRFRNRPIEIFPWRIHREKRENLTVFRALQSSGEHAGYRYALNVEISIPDYKPEIRWLWRLENTGTLPLEGSVYAHPFFAGRADCAGSWYAFPGRGRRLLVPGSLERTLFPGGFPVDCREVSVGGFSAGEYVVTIAADRPFGRVHLWRHGGTFAIEPYLPFRIAPGETYEWSWTLSFHFPEEGNVDSP